MSRQITLPDGRRIDLDYFVEWRPYLWRRPTEIALRHLGDLRGKRILEIGGRNGRMTSLFALLGAHATLLECDSLDTAEREVAKWDIADRVELIRTDGSFDAIAGRRFDAAFTKSVLYGQRELERLLRTIADHLTDDATVAFVENYRGGRLLAWLRRRVMHRKRYNYEDVYCGIRSDQLPLFRGIFRDVRIQRHQFFVYTILGTNRPASERSA